jgi:arsenical pump membrane protein
VAGVLLAASALNADLGLPTCIAGLAVAALVSLRSQSNPVTLLRHISWSVLPLVAALFVLVEAVNSIGALRFTDTALRAASAWSSAAAVFVTGFAVGIGNNLVNNLPLGLIAATTLRHTGLHGLLANAVLVGVDLGPNLSVTGSLATILWLIALRREGVDVSAGRFLRVGVVAMPVALALALAALLLHPA